MASYISKYTGKQIDGAIKLFEGKGLSNVTGVVQRNSDGNFSTKTISTVATTGSYNDLTDKPTIPPQLTAGTGITIDSNNVISVNLVNAETQSF